jgi:hypothetical protein
MTPENVTGLVVGEGCFYVESGPDPKYRSGWRIRPAFCIEMRYDDREVLVGVRDHLGCGSVYDLDFGRYRGYESRGWKPHAKYRVSNLADLYSKVLPFFRRYPLFGRKLGAFELFERIVELKMRKEHLEPRGLETAKRLARQLTKHNRKGESGSPDARDVLVRWERDLGSKDRNHRPSHHESR